MKKAFYLTLSLLFAVSAAFAAEPVGTDAERAAHREEMKAIKAEQRANHKKDAKPADAKPGFWQKEADRSGLGRMSNAGSFLQNLNPMPFFKSQDEQYKARKAAEQKK